MSTADEASTINELAADPVPTMPVPNSGEVKLLRGIGKRDENTGEIDWFDVAHVRELTGDDEETLAALETKEGLTYTEFMNHILSRAVVSIGDLVVADAPGMLNKLILADRDMLFLGAVRATYGLTRDVRVICPHCRASNDVQINLDEDFPIDRSIDDPRQPIEVKTFKGTYNLRLPTGEDVIYAQKHSKNTAQFNTVMIGRCTVFSENRPADTSEWARNLNAGVRRQLVQALEDIKLGPNLEGVDTQCAECGKNMPISLDWVSLLLG